jgi:inorganic pyrophosphatase
MDSSPYWLLDPVDPETGTVNAIIDTPKGSRNKYKYDPKRGLFRLTSVLPAGAAFPHNFGYLPSTLAEDGDPLDILVLMDDAAFVGCLVSVRLIGVIEAEQSEGGKTTRNDRLLGIAAEGHLYRDLHTPEDLTPGLLHEIEHFFVSYNQSRGREFRVLGHSGPEQAGELVEQARERFRSHDSAAAGG